MPYKLTPEAAASITDLDKTFGTTSFLPKMEDIPDDFKQFRGNVYVRTADAIFGGDDLPDATMTFKDGFTAKMMQDLVTAHLRSFEPKHQHKIAGVAYMLSQMATFEEIIHVRA